jgi:AbrB family looped-hinge helix DNA binding protein
MSEEVLGEVYISKVSSKGQLTLPKDLREAYHLREGEAVILIAAKEGILLKHSDDVSLGGLWKGLFDPEEAEKWIEELRSQWRGEKPTSSTP